MTPHLHVPPPAYAPHDPSQTLLYKVVAAHLETFLAALDTDPDGWAIGTPDVVLEMPAAFDVPSTGQIPIQKFRVPTGFTEDVWVRAAQALPGDRK